LRLLLPSLLLVCAWSPGSAQTGENVLVVVNRNSPLSRRIGEYYSGRRAIPQENVCSIDAPSGEEISWQVHETKIEAAIASCLKNQNLEDQILYLVTTIGVPLKIAVPGSTGPGTEAGAVDSELTLLYGKMRGVKYRQAGFVPNPFFRRLHRPFRRPEFPIYLVTRLAGYDFEDVRGLIDRSLVAANRGKFVFDLKKNHDQQGNTWLRRAARLLPAGRVVIEESEQVLYEQRDVIGYAGWGSNDPDRKQRRLGFQWLPGALVTEFVSTNGRTFQRPPENWNIGAWKDRANWFAGSPQTMTADYIEEGATGASGHAYEPYLSTTPRPDYLFPAYFSGRNLAESYYVSMGALGWQTIVVGDPLCRLEKPR